MVLDKRFERPNLVLATLEGVVTYRDQVQLLDWVRVWAQSAGPVRVLIALEGFAGWKADLPFENVTSWLDDDDGSVLQIAIVGEPAWKARVLTFLAQPLRRVPLEYFRNETAAREWLHSYGGAHPTTDAAAQCQSRRRPGRLS